MSEEKWRNVYRGDCDCKIAFFVTLLPSEMKKKKRNGMTGEKSRKMYGGDCHRDRHCDCHRTVIKRRVYDLHTLPAGRKASRWSQGVQERRGAQREGRVCEREGNKMLSRGNCHNHVLITASFHVISAGEEWRGSVE